MFVVVWEPVAESLFFGAVFRSGSAGSQATFQIGSQCSTWTCEHTAQLPLNKTEWNSTMQKHTIIFLFKWVPSCYTNPPTDWHAQINTLSIFAVLSWWLVKVHIVILSTLDGNVWLQWCWMNVGPYSIADIYSLQFRVLLSPSNERRKLTCLSNSRVACLQTRFEILISQSNERVTFRIVK